MAPQRSNNEPIAIIGTGCRFPGDATSPHKLWELLREPRDVSSKIPESRFNADAFYHPDNSHHGTSNVQESYLLSQDPRHFDAQFFGIKPVEANSIDPQQRLLLETVYESVEAAGLPLEKLQGSSTAVYVGLMCGDYADLLSRDPDSFPTYFATGTARSIMSNRISYFFDWHGPSMTIDTACSSSLVAVHQAVQTLRSGESHVAIAAGANLILGPEPYIAESKLKMLSPTGRSRMWDRDADGYARGDGFASIVLKTLSSALADGDHIECIVRETGLNQDGRTKGITMPSAVAQAELIRNTYAKAGLDLNKRTDRPQYFEAHGTGTPAGDPIEAEAISTAFFSNRPGFKNVKAASGGRDILHVGSIKTVVGHTEGTAGLAAVVKASLALQAGIVPPNRLLKNLSPTVKPFYDNLQVPQKSRSWPTIQDGAPRRVSVNSFGFGGANSHAILESYVPSPNDIPRTQIHSHVFTPFNFSAASERALASQLASFSAYLKSHKTIDLRDLSWTLNTRKSAFSVRTSVSACNVEKLCESLDQKLEAWETKASISTTVRSTAASARPRVLGIFTGQGAQWASMAAELIKTSKPVQATVADLEQSLAELPVQDRPSWSIRQELLANAKQSRVNQAAISQPLCAAVQIILVNLLRSASITFEAVVGHSSGEIGAAYAAGYISSRDAIRIAYYRGLHLKLAQGQNGKTGAMMAVGTSIEDAKELCELPSFQGRICVAASNSPASVTLSGDADAIEEAKEVFEEEKRFVRLLKVDKAYHSHHMDKSSEAYIRSLRGCNISIQKGSSRSTWISSVYGEDINDVQDNLEDLYWNNNMVKPVLFVQAVQFAVAEKGSFDLVIEVGPHPGLKGPAQQTIQDFSGADIPYTGVLSRGKNDVEAFAGGMGYIWSSLNEPLIDFTGLDKYASGHSEPPRLLKDLPTYRWDHDRVFWYESRTSRNFRTRSDPTHELLGTKCSDGSEEHIRWRNFLSPREIPWLEGHQVQSQMVFPGAGYVSTALEAMRFVAGTETVKMIEIQNFIIGQALVFNDEDTGVETMLTLSDLSRTVSGIKAHFSFHSAVAKEASNMALNASGSIEVIFGEPSTKTLPPRPAQDFSLLDIESERFYSFLRELGFGYTGVFKALTSLKRKMDTASGSIAIPKGSLMVHPATLDAAIQSVILAYCFPGDTRLRSIHVPTRIDRIRINPSLCSQETNLMHFQSIVNSDRPSEIAGDVSIYAEDGLYGAVQLEGMHTKPLSTATPENDFALFSEMIWEFDTPNGNAVALDREAIAKESESLAFLLERVAYYYLRNLDNVISKEERKRLAWHHEKLFNYVDHVLSQVTDGTHRYGKIEWKSDTHSEILGQIKRYPGSIDLRIMHAVGENMPAVVRGETTMLEPMMQNNMLNDFYVEGLGMSEYMTYLARMMSQIGHRYPHMNVLEIGAGTGGATKRILKELNNTCASYTYTDISSGFFEKAHEIFEPYHVNPTFKTLDIEKNIVEQGFTEHSVDVIVASLVLHATRDLEQCMNNVRRLLKPGGYLLLLEITDLDQIRFGFIFGGLPGWWLGYDDGRTLSPCITAPEWDTVMKKCGFGGIIAITPHHETIPIPLAVIATQAIDDRIEHLHRPLSYPSLELATSELTIIGGQTPSTSNLVQNLQTSLKLYYSKISTVSSVATLSDVPFMGSVLSLADLDEPIFKSPDSRTLQGAQQLFRQSKNILWITRGCRADNPYSNMIVGFGRAIVLEMPHLRLQFLDIGDDVAAKTFAEKMLQLELTDLWEQQGTKNEVLWSVEPEIALEKGQYLVPRLKLNKSRNERYNSARRMITKEVDLKSTRAKLVNSEVSYIIREDTKLSAAESHKNVTVHVSHCTLRAFKVTDTDCVFIALGTNTLTGEQVIILSCDQASVVRLPRTWSIPCPTSVDEGLQFMMVLYNHLLAQAVIADMSAGESLVILEPEEAFAAVLLRRAGEKGVKVAFVTTTLNAKADQYIYIHPQAPARIIKAQMPTGTLRFIDMSGDHPVASHIFKCLPQTCKFVSWSDLHPTRSFVDHAILSAFVPGILKHAWSRSRNEYFSVNMENVPIIAVDNIKPAVSLGNKVCLVDWATKSTVAVQLEPVDSRPMFSDDKTYWLVGLTGGLGQSLCEWMIRRGAKYVVITSRNPKVDARWKAAMKSLGATVKLFSSDITDRTSVRALYDDISRTLPPIAGVAQGAMVLHDTMFLDLDMAKMENVLKPKVQGSIYLDELFTEPSLEFFVFFSSMAAVTGNQGQSAYAAANMFMAALAAQRRKRGLAASAINIGAIVGNGYVTRELDQSQQEFLRKVGNTWMSEQDFHLIFAEAIVAGCPGNEQIPELMTGLRLVHTLDEEKTTWFDNPKFQHCVLNDEAASAGTTNNKPGIPIKVQLLSVTTADEVHEILEDAFVAKLQVALQADTERSIVDLTADELGMDSLVAVDIRSWFLKELSVDMPVLKILSGSTVNDLLAHAQENLPPGLVPDLRKDGSSIVKSAKPKNKHSNQAHTAQDTVLEAPTALKSGTLKTNEGQHEEDTRFVSRASKAWGSSSPGTAGKVNGTSSPAPAVSPMPQTIDPRGLLRRMPTVLAPERSLSTTPDYSSSDSETRSSGWGVDSRTKISLESSTSELSSSFIGNPDSAVGEAHNLEVKPGSHTDALQKIVPMSFGQTRFWFLRSYLEDQTTFNVTTSIRMTGNIRIDKFEKAVEQTGQRHEALRTKFFVNEQNKPMQGILSDSKLRLERKTISSDTDIEDEYRKMREHVFDLEEGNTMRILLLTLSSTSHQIIIGYHHINMDGISLEILLADLQKAYYAQSMNEKVLQYPTFSERQSAEHSSGKWANELNFWRQVFETTPEPLPILPLSRTAARPTLTKYAFNSSQFRVSSALSARILEACRRVKVTPFHFYLAVFKTLLARFVEVDDMCIGIADGNRKDVDTTDGLGFYLNLLPVRLRSQVKQPFNDILKEARAKSLDALSNSRVPFDVLLQELEVPRSSAHSPLFQAFLNYRQGIDEERTFCDCHSEGLKFDGGLTAYDLTIDILDNSKGDSLIILAGQQVLYTSDNVATLANSFLNLLEAFARNPAARANRPSLFKQGDIQEAIELGRGLSYDFKWPETISHRIDQMVSMYPNQTALKDGLDIALSYSQMAKRVNTIAAELRSCRARSGSIIGVFQEPSTDWICSLLAIMRIGAVYVPLDQRLSMSRLAQVVADCKPSLIVVDGSTSALAKQLQTSTNSVDVSSISMRNVPNIPNTAKASSTAVIIYTSGSTGTPKGIVMKHSNFKASIEIASQQFGLQEGAEIVLQQSSFSFDMSLFQSFVALTTGGMLYVVPKALRGESVKIADIIVSESVSFTSGTPSEYLSWLQHGDTAALRKSNWRVAISGGEKTTAQLTQGFSKLGNPTLRVFDCYGPTEVTFCSNSAEIFYQENDLELNDGLSTWPAYSIYIVDDNLKPVPVNVPGEIMVGGVGVADGYLNDDEMSTHAFLSDDRSSAEFAELGWTKMHRTGDRGRLTDSGSLIIEGRVKGDTQVKLRGLRVELRDIEATIIQTSNNIIAEAVVSVRQTTSSVAQLLVAHVAFSHGKRPQEPKVYLDNILRDLPLPQYMHPSLIIPLEEIPKNNSNKIDRLAVATLPLPNSQPKIFTSSNLTETEDRLKCLWESILPRDIVDYEGITSSTDFFRVGGSSLLLVNLQQLIQKEFETSIQLAQLFETSTLGSMAYRLQPPRGADFVDVSKAELIDYESEIELSSDLFQLSDRSGERWFSINPSVIVLTGASGFMGREILRQLIRDSTVERIHCIAIRRSLQQLPPVFSSKKVIVHQGDLALPLLGLTEQTVSEIFTEADAVIHNGADVSFLKTYSSLKVANVESTKELVKLTLPYRLPFHYVSSASIAHLSGQETFTNRSIAPAIPPDDGSDGYTATKWVSERYLEKVSEHFGLPVWIHRPSSVTGDEASDVDLMSNLLKYSRMMRATPHSSLWGGYFDFISVGRAVSEILTHVYNDNSASLGSPLTYVFESSELEIPVSDMRSVLEREEGEAFDQLPVREWVKKAEEAGLNPMVAAYINSVADVPMVFPRLVKE